MLIMRCGTYILAVDADQNVSLLDLLAGICRSPDAQGLDIDIVVVVGRIGAIFEDQSHTTLSSAETDTLSFASS